MERAAGVEPAIPPWEGGALPLRNARKESRPAFNFTLGPLASAVWPAFESLPGELNSVYIRTEDACCRYH
jgi:hypothetical protein